VEAEEVHGVARPLPFTLCSCAPTAVARPVRVVHGRPGTAGAQASFGRPPRGSSASTATSARGRALPGRPSSAATPPQLAFQVAASSGCWLKHWSRRARDLRAAVLARKATDMGES
jgi:hypothetical protein